MTEAILTEDEIAARIAAQAERAALAADQPSERHGDLEAAVEALAANRRADDAALQAAAAQRYRFVRPNTEWAEGLIEVTQNTEGRYMLGIKPIDMLIRGFGRKELAFITGYTHSGKSQVLLTSICNNRDKRIIWFCPDEPAELVLTKLICMRTRSNAERLEQRIRDNDREALERVRRIARHDFSNLVIIDEPLTLGDMAAALQEAEDWWGGRADMVGIDFLEQIRHDDSDVEKLARELKQWTKDQDVPVLCIHQGSRGNAGKGQVLSMNSMRYGGEAEAIFVLGVRRKRDDESLEEWERASHHDTISLSVIKNKRPPGRRTDPEGIDFYMDAECGLVLPLSERPAPPPGPNVVQVLRAQQQQHDEPMDTMEMF